MLTHHGHQIKKNCTESGCDQHLATYDVSFIDHDTVSMKHHSVTLQRWEVARECTSLVQALHERLDTTSFDANTEMTVTSTMLRSAIQIIWIWQFHQMDHFRPDVQPCPTVWELVMRSVRIDRQTCTPHEVCSHTGRLSTDPHQLGIDPHQVRKEVWT